jgi:hypothetical protein
MQKSNANTINPGFPHSLPERRSKRGQVLKHQLCRGFWGAFGGVGSKSTSLMKPVASYRIKELMAIWLVVHIERKRSRRNG